MTASIYVLFFLSGISGLIYQVVWVRQFGHIFGHTVYSAAAVTAVFMAGLGWGGYVCGRWVDPAYARNSSRPLVWYGRVEIAIGAWCLLISFLLPKMPEMLTWMSSYKTGTHGWFYLSLPSHVAHIVVTALVLAPPTFLMGGTLTLLIRHIVGQDILTGQRKTAWLYGLNALGAALGALGADFILVPNLGYNQTQWLAALLNVTIGLTALALVRFLSPSKTTRRVPLPRGWSVLREEDPTIRQASLALFITGFAAIGFEIVAFRLLTSLLGGYRTVLATLLAVVLIGIWLGSSLAGGLLKRADLAANLWAIAQFGLAASVLAPILIFDAGFVTDHFESLRQRLLTADPTYRDLLLHGFNIRVVLLSVGLPAIFMGFSFPVAHAYVQRQAPSVGHHAGVLYLANTTGNMLGALGAGFVFLPWVGSQISISIFSAAALLSILPMVKSFIPTTQTSRARAVPAVVFAVGTFMLLGFGFLPADYLIAKSFAITSSTDNRQILAHSEGVNDVLVVTEIPGVERRLHTNGHSMSSTALSGQRYMRAFVHLPLLQIEAPENVLVICFGVGNTAHAASLYPSVQRIEVADLSQNVLEHAPYFESFNHQVLRDPRVSVFVNDGRHHLRMQADNTYDLITLEPPPITFAGVSSLYTQEFYELASQRLRVGGFMTQWLPAYQVPGTTTLTMIQAFLRAFPNAVLLSGFSRELILVGRKEQPNLFDVSKVADNLHKNLAVSEDLRTIRMQTMTELVGAFAASSETLKAATQHSDPLADDRPILEYAAHSRFIETRQPPALFNVQDANTWCPDCFGPLRPPELETLPAYLELMDLVYTSDGFLHFPGYTGRISRTFALKPQEAQREDAITQSPYLQMLLRNGWPESLPLD